MNSLTLRYIRVCFVVLFGGGVTVAYAQDGDVLGWQQLRPLTFEIDSPPVKSTLKQVEVASFESDTNSQTLTEESPVRSESPNAMFRAEALAADDADKLSEARENLRNATLNEGEESAANRDALTSEFFTVMRWTLVALIFGGCLAVGLKKLPQFKTPMVAGRQMTIVETLSLGRHQNLNLIQAGGERFLIAADASGIKSVTLIPNWSDDQYEEEVDPAQPGTTSSPSMFSRTMKQTRVA